MEGTTNPRPWNQSSPSSYQMVVPSSLSDSNQPPLLPSSICRCGVVSMLNLTWWKYRRHQVVEAETTTFFFSQATKMEWMQACSLFYQAVKLIIHNRWSSVKWVQRMIVYPKASLSPPTARMMKMLGLASNGYIVDASPSNESRRVGLRTCP